LRKRELEQVVLNSFQKKLDFFSALLHFDQLENGQLALELVGRLIIRAAAENGGGLIGSR